MPNAPVSRNFQRRLSARILAVLGAACVAAPAASCSSERPSGTSTSTSTGGATTTSGHGGAGDAGAVPDGDVLESGSTTSTDAATDAVQAVSVRLCMPWPVPVHSDAGSDPDAGLDAGSDPDAGIATGSTPDAGVDPGPCPTDPTVVVTDFESLGCPNGWEPTTILDGPVPNSVHGVCCYDTLITVCGPGGRPYLEGSEALLAPVERSDGADGWREGASPRLDGLPAEARSRLAAAWAEDARREHASVASFARAALGLLAMGAPADLVALTHEAALDEVRHAQRCFALASAYAGEALGPGRFPIEGSVAMATTLAEIAAGAALEGCVGETVAAAVAGEQLARATDPAVRAALAEIAEDEARHAELAWRTVAWAVRTGGPAVRAAVVAAFSKAARAAGAEGAAVPPVLEAHGRLTPATLAEVTAATMTHVVAPAVRALLAGGAPATAPSLHA